MENATSQGNGTTAVVPQSTLTPVPSKKTTTTIVTPQSSIVLKNIAPTTEGEERPSHLFEGTWEFAKPGYPSLPFAHLAVYTCGDETLAVLSHKPKLVSHREAAEQIVQALGAIPSKFLYLHRTCMGPEGAGAGLSRDLIVHYAFDWEWTHSRWITTQQTFCYRVLSATEKAIARLLSLYPPQATADTQVIEASSGS